MVSVTYNGGTYYLPEQGDRYLWAQGPNGTNGLTALLAAITSVGGTIQALTGDVTATGPGTVAATVALVGGSTAVNVHNAELLANAATNANTINTIVKRDGSGNFSAGTITATLTGTATNFSGSLVGEVTGTQGATVVSNAVSANTASAIVRRDANKNFIANNVVQGLTSTATAAGTTALTVASSKVQQFTGATTQTCVFPDATTLSVGWEFIVINRSSGTVTVNANGGGLLLSATAGTTKTFLLTANGTAAGTWDQR